MKNIIISIFSFIFICCKSNHTNCSNVYVNVFSSYNEELTVHDNIDREKSTKIQPDEEAGWRLKIIDKDDYYFKVNINDLNLNNVWVSKGSVYVNTRNYDIKKTPLYHNPTKESSVADYIVEEQTVVVEDVCNGWALVRATNLKGLLIKGWLEPEMQCGNPYTTCP